MASRIRTYNKSGILIWESSAPSFREWVINDIGKAEFTVKALGLEQYIERGNYITIEHDELDTWVGIINTPRPWASKAFTVNAKSAMWLFSQRVGSYEQPVTGSWGAVFSQIIGIVNSAESTLLQIGSYDEGISFSSVVDMSNVYTYLQRALVQSQARLDFRSVVTKGQLKIFIDVSPTLYTASDLIIEEGYNVKNGSPLLLEQGDIYNDVTIMGVGLQQEKLIARAEDASSILKYGRRQILFAEGQSQSDVDRLAVVRLAQYAYPRKTLSLGLINKGDTFRNSRVGNIGKVELKTVDYLGSGLGFRGTANIKTLQFNDGNQELAAIFQEN